MNSWDALDLIKSVVLLLSFKTILDAYKSRLSDA